MHFGTKAVHAGQTPDPMTGAIMPPIYMSSTFVLDSPGVNRGFEYTRANNPNYEILEKNIAALENGKHATVFSSGLGALTALITSLLSPGDRVLAIDGIYGGSYRLFTQVFARYGIILECCSAQEIPSKWATNPKWLFFETPTNPLLEVFDIEKMSAEAHRHGALSIVDNTFASPYLQNPLDLGADIVWHSSTKYLGGHSDVIGGVAVTQSDEIDQKLKFARKSIGVNPSPFDCWLIGRGIKTLHLRMEQHEKNGNQIAHFLTNHPKVKKVYYPGLENDPGHAIARKQMRGFGGMVSAEFHLPKEKMMELISSFKLFALAESLGGVESLVNHPATMTHASIPAAERARIGLSDGLIRFSIGIEDPQDLIEDLTLGLENVS